MRKIRLFGVYFEQFMLTLTQNEQKKINYILDLLKWNEKISSKFVKHLRDGLFVYKAFKIKEEYYASK